jgi:hypothetical protein
VEPFPPQRLNDSTHFWQQPEIINKSRAGTGFFWHMNCGKKFHG